MILASLAALGALVVAFVLVPVFTRDESMRSGFLSDAERELLDLEETKTRLYENIADLDFEKDAGKVSEKDYAAARDDYLAQVAEVMSRIDVLAPAQAAAEPTSEKTKSKPKANGRTAKKDTRACGHCGATSPNTAKFCVECGRPLAAGCTSCGEELPAGARFCPGCGKQVGA